MCINYFRRKEYPFLLPGHYTGHEDGDIHSAETGSMTPHSSEKGHRTKHEEQTTCGRNDNLHQAQQD